MSASSRPLTSALPSSLTSAVSVGAGGGLVVEASRAPARRRSPRSAGRPGPASWGGRAGCGQPRQRHRRRRRVRRGTSQGSPRREVVRAAIGARRQEPHACAWEVHPATRYRRRGRVLPRGRPVQALVGDGISGEVHSSHRVRGNCGQPTFVQVSALTALWMTGVDASGEPAAVVWTARRASCRSSRCVHRGWGRRAGPNHTFSTRAGPRRRATPGLRPGGPAS